MITTEVFINDFKALLSSEAEITLDTDLLDIDEWDSFSAQGLSSHVQNQSNIPHCCLP